MKPSIIRYRARRKEMLDYLGGFCVVCGTTKNLEVDHKNHKNKSFTVSERWGIPWKDMVVELKKCQLLCRTHHMIKSKSEGSLAKGWTNQPRQRHGSVWSYQKYGCRCDLCAQAKTDAMAVERIWREARELYS